MVCQILDCHLNSTKLPYNVKHEVQNNITEVDEANKLEGLKPTDIIKVQLKEVKLFDSITPQQMAELQKRDPQLSLIYDKVLSKNNLGCQRYTVSGQLLLGGYCYSMTAYH